VSEHALEASHHGSSPLPGQTIGVCKPEGGGGGVPGPGFGAGPLGPPFPPLLLCPELLKSPSEPLLGSPPGAAKVHNTLSVMVRGGVLQRAPRGAS
jgi:hypothetical protein